jgi:hypothetical protein
MKKYALPWPILALLATVGTPLPAKMSVADEQTKIRKTAQATLNKLYDANPKARAVIRK